MTDPRERTLDDVEEQIALLDRGGNRGRYQIQARPLDDLRQQNANVRRLRRNRKIIFSVVKLVAGILVLSALIVALVSYPVLDSKVKSEKGVLGRAAIFEVVQNVSEMGDNAIEMPVTTTEMSWRSVEMGGNASEMPVTTTEMPWRSVEMGGNASEMPVTNTEIPLITTEIADQDWMTERPERSNLTTTEMPGSTTEMPGSTTDLPITTTEMPITTTEIDVTTTEMPITTTDLPITTTEMPITTTEMPITTTEIDVTNRQRGDIPVVTPDDAYIYDSEEIGSGHHY